MRRIRTASIATLGCKLNQGESDQMARQLAEAGVVMVPFGQKADLYLVNSCTVTHIGDRKSRQLIRQATRVNPEAFVVVAGCYAETDGDAVRAIDGVDAVVGNHGKERLVELLREQELEFGGENGSSPVAVFDVEGGIETSPSRTRAFVKIQEGCDNHCSYCIVPTARGHQQSRPAAAVVDEIWRLEGEGHQEVVLTGVNITAYGRDWGSASTRDNVRGQGLLRLLEKILADTAIPRVRLSSLQPEDWNPGLYDLCSSGRICRHLHLSLQSGCDSVLTRMRRRYNVDRYRVIVEEARRALPGVAITTDVIVGFPGETEEEHQETEDFLCSIGFAGLHVFKYSPRSGTPAAIMPDQVDSRVKQERSERLIALAGEMATAFRSQFVGTVLGILWEEPLPAKELQRLGLEGNGRESSWWSGLSDNYVRVYAPGTCDLTGTISGARVERLAPDGAVGRLVR